MAVAHAKGRPRRSLVVLVSVGLVAALLFGANAVIELLEDRGVIDTYRGSDDNVHYLDGELYVDIGKGMSETTQYARRSIVESYLRTDKGDGWRAFVLGGSFAMGTPYVHQHFWRETPGGISSWLRALLAGTSPDTRVEIANVATGGGTVTRVLSAARAVTAHEPDVLVVASCNNEGELAPNAITASLRKFGGFRLLTKLLAGDASPEERSLFTLQDPDTEAVRVQFREALHEIAKLAKDEGVPVLLCTLPVNLLYSPHVTTGYVAEPKWDPREADPNYAERGDEVPGEAREPKPTSEGPDSLWYAARELREKERYEEASRLLEQYVELNPMNRCRPSLNAIIREVAGQYDHVHLVDLERRARELSPHGLPGGNLFVDYCHMNWLGYAEMAEEIARALVEHELLPPGSRGVESFPSRELIRRAFDLRYDAAGHPFAPKDRAPAFLRNHRPY